MGGSEFTKVLGNENNIVPQVNNKNARNNYDNFSKANNDKLIKYFITDSKSVDVFKQKLENIIESILNEEFEANPAEGFWTCKRCPFKNICEEACMN